MKLVGVCARNASLEKVTKVVALGFDAECYQKINLLGECFRASRHQVHGKIKSCIVHRGKNKIVKNKKKRSQKVTDWPAAECC